MWHRLIWLTKTWPDNSLVTDTIWYLGTSWSQRRWLRTENAAPSCASYSSTSLMANLTVLWICNQRWRILLWGDNLLIENIYDEFLLLYRVYFALLVIVNVTMEEESQEYEKELCIGRRSDWRHNQHNYIFSGYLKRVNMMKRIVRGNFRTVSLLQQNERRMDWKSARRFCRKRCMDLVSIGRLQY